MQLKDSLALIISIVAAGLSVWTARRTWGYSIANLRLASRNNYMNALFDIDRQLIAYPSLWIVLDAAVASGFPNAASAEEVARRRGFIWYHINLFEMVWSDIGTDQLGSRNRDERLYWDAWVRYIETFVKGSPEAQAIIKAPRALQIVNRDFDEYLKSKC